jgi:hypothetical protein
MLDRIELPPSNDCSVSLISEGGSVAFQTPLAVNELRNNVAAYNEADLARLAERRLAGNSFLPCFVNKQQGSF